MNRIYLAGGGLVVGVFLFGLGRYTAPTKTVTVTQKGETVTVYQDRIVYRDKKVDTHTDTTTVVIKRPDGTEETTTKKVEDTNSDTKTTDHSQGSSVATKTETTSKTVDFKKPDWKVTGMVGLGVQSLSLTNLPVQPVYGAMVERRLLGPLSAGLWGTFQPANHSGQAGLALSLEF